MGLAVPVTAIGSSPEGNTVMRVKDGLAERVVVTLGIRDNGMVEITQGLAMGDLVVTKAGAFVRAGDRINPVLATEKTN
jgi:HlyD family secretion protein